MNRPIKTLTLRSDYHTLSPRTIRPESRLRRNFFSKPSTAFNERRQSKGAVELDFFTAMADGPATASELAQHCHAAERGAWILAEYKKMLATAGFGEVESHDLPPMWRAIIARK